MLLKPEQHLNRFLRELESIVNGYLAIGKKHWLHSRDSDEDSDRVKSLQQYQVKCRLLRQQLDDLLVVYRRILPGDQLADRFLEVLEHMVQLKLYEMAVNVFHPYAEELIEQVSMDSKHLLLVRLQMCEYRCAIRLYSNRSESICRPLMTQIQHSLKFMDEWLYFMETHQLELVQSGQLRDGLHEFHQHLLHPLICHLPLPADQTAVQLFTDMIVPALRLIFLFDETGIHSEADASAVYSLFEAVFQMQLRSSRPLGAINWLADLKEKYVDVDLYPNHYELNTKTEPIKGQKEAIALLKDRVRSVIEQWILALRVRTLADPDWEPFLLFFEQKFDNASNSSHQPSNPLIPHCYEVVMKRRKFLVKHDEKQSRKIKFRMGENTELPRFTPVQIVQHSLGYHMSKQETFVGKSWFVLSVLKWCVYVDEPLRIEKPVFHQMVTLLSDLALDLAATKDEVLKGSSESQIKELLQFLAEVYFQLQDWRRFDETVVNIRNFEMEVDSLAPAARVLIHLRQLWPGKIKIDKKLWRPASWASGAHPAPITDLLSIVNICLNNRDVLPKFALTAILPTIQQNIWEQFLVAIKDLSGQDTELATCAANFLKNVGFFDFFSEILWCRRCVTTGEALSYSCSLIKIQQILNLSGEHSLENGSFEKCMRKTLNFLEKLRDDIGILSPNELWSLDKALLGVDAHNNCQPLLLKIGCLQTDFYMSLFTYEIKHRLHFHEVKNYQKDTKQDPVVMTYESLCQKLAQENFYLQALFWICVINSIGSDLNAGLLEEFFQKVTSSIKRAKEYELKQTEYWSSDSHMANISQKNSNSITFAVSKKMRAKIAWIKVLAKRGRNCRVTALDDSYVGTGMLFREGKFRHVKLENLETNLWMTFNFYGYDKNNNLVDENIGNSFLIVQPLPLLAILGYAYRTAIDFKITHVEQDIQNQLFGYFSYDRLLSAIDVSTLPDIDSNRILTTPSNILQNIVESILNKYGSKIATFDNSLHAISQLEVQTVQNCYALYIALGMINRQDSRLSCLLSAALYQCVSILIYRENPGKIFKKISLFIHQTLVEHGEHVDAALRIRLVPVFVRLTYALIRSADVDKHSFAKSSVECLKKLCPYQDPLIFSTVKLSHTEEIMATDKIKKKNTKNNSTIVVPDWVYKLCYSLHEYLSVTTLNTMPTYIKELGHTTALHEIVSMLKNNGPELVSKELLKFRKNDRFLEITVAIIRWAYNSNKLDYCIDLCMEMFEWIHRRNKYLLYPNAMNENEKRFWRRRGYYRGTKQHIVADPPTLKTEKISLKYIEQDPKRKRRDFRSPSPLHIHNVSGRALNPTEAGTIIATNLPKMFKRYKYRKQFRQLLKVEAIARAEMSKVFGLALMRKSDMVDDGVDLVKTPSMPSLNKISRKKATISYENFDLEHTGEVLGLPSMAEMDRQFPEDQILLPDVLQSLTQYIVLSSRYSNYLQTIDGCKRLWNIHLQLRGDPVGKTRLYHEYLWRSMCNATNSLLDVLSEVTILIAEENNGIVTETEVPKGEMKDIPEDFLFKFTPTRISDAAFRMKWYSLHARAEKKIEVNFRFLLRFMIRSAELLYAHKQYHKTILMVDSINKVTGFIRGEQLLKLSHRCHMSLKLPTSQTMVPRDNIIFLEKRRSQSFTQSFKARCIVSQIVLSQWKKNGGKLELPLSLMAHMNVILRVYRNTVNEANLNNDTRLNAKCLAEIADIYYLTGDLNSAQECWSKSIDILLKNKNSWKELTSNAHAVQVFDVTKSFLAQWRAFELLLSSAGKIASTTANLQEKSNLSVLIGSIVDNFLNFSYGSNAKNASYKDKVHCLVDQFSSLDVDFLDDTFVTSPEVFVAILEQAGKECARLHHHDKAASIFALHDYVAWYICDDKRLLMKSYLLRLKTAIDVENHEEVESLKKAIETMTVFAKEPKVHNFLDSVRYRRDINDEIHKSSRVYGIEFINEISGILKE